MHFKGNTCPRCKSTFSSEKSANDHCRRNLKRKTCAKPRVRKRDMFLQDDQRRVRPRTEEKEEEGSARSKRFLESLDSRLRDRQERAKTIKWVRGSWFATHAFSNQSGQGGPSATSHHREAGQASCNREKPSIAKQKDMLGQLLKMYTTPDQLLPEIAACVWFKAKKTERHLLSFMIHTWSPLHQVWISHSAHVHRSATARRTSTQRTIGESAVAGAHRAMRLMRLPQSTLGFVFNPDRRRLTQRCHLQRPSFYTFFSRTETM